MAGSDPAGGYPQEEECLECYAGEQAIATSPVLERPLILTIVRAMVYTVLLRLVIRIRSRDRT
jgi:hypothetical protein